MAENQAKLANLIAYAPTNPAAFKSIDAQGRARGCRTAPDNVNKGFVINAALLARPSEGADGALGGVEAGLTRWMRQGLAAVLPAVLVMAVAFLLPVGWLLSRAFTEPAPGFSNFVLLWQRPVYLRVIWNTRAGSSAIVTPICRAARLSGGACRWRTARRGCGAG